MRQLLLLQTLLLGIFLGSNLASAQDPSDTAYRIVETTDQLQVFRGSQLAGAYRFASGSKPILWPLIGPDQVELTRKWPMSEDDPNEKRDHIHHRSLWFTHGEVNDIDYWAEGEGRGTIRHQRIDAQQADAQQAIIQATLAWESKDGSPLLLETRSMRFHGTTDQPRLDCNVELTAQKEDVHFGDTKEGTFGIRVAESMKLEATPAGSILNSEGDKNNDAWGKPARWVDYTGPIQEGIYGITVMVHPSTFRHPGRWHVRGYGLFAHNPFGLRHFVGDDQAQGGGHLLPAGSSLKFAYRLLFHKGPMDPSAIDAEYQAYAAESPSARIDSGR